MPRIHFQQQLAGLKDKLLAMASLAQQSVSSALEACVLRDEHLCKVVKPTERAINSAHANSSDVPAEVGIASGQNAHRGSPSTDRIGERTNCSQAKAGSTGSEVVLGWFLGVSEVVRPWINGTLIDFERKVSDQKPKSLSHFAAWPGPLLPAPRFASRASTRRPAMVLQAP
jgi:hypothetical protein